MSFDNSIDELKHQALSGILGLSTLSGNSLEYTFWQTLVSGINNGTVPVSGLDWKPTVGGFLSNSINGTGILASSAYTADYIIMSPTVFPAAMTVDQVEFNVSTAAALASGKVCVYRSNSSKRPDVLEVEVTGIDLTTTGTKTVTFPTPLTVTKGEILWVGIRSSVTGPVISGHQAYSSLTIEGNSTITSGGYKSIRRTTLPFATPAPAAWTYAASELTASFNAIALSWRVSA